ncbi:MAG: hypothetical protein QW614_01115 [Candidatus Caldarchaeum sp.]|uniref:RloB domain-containing protein n=1 Tax=Caldiarchaeum subterraneum TaxID=311458 RepID=A0A7C5LBX7_CALS0
MKLVNDPSQIKNGEAVILITGDGQTEHRLTKALCRKIDGGQGRKYLFWPRGPLPSKTTGLRSLEQVKILMQKYPINCFLWICDRKHLRDRDKWSEVVESLKEYGINAEIINDWKHLACFRLNIGSREGFLWVAISGEERNIEENLAKLIKVRLNLDVEPKLVRDTLKQRGINMDTLVSEATDEQINISMPSLFNVLKLLHNDC